MPEDLIGEIREKNIEITYYLHEKNASETRPQIYFRTITFATHFESVKTNHLVLKYWNT